MMSEYGISALAFAATCALLALADTASAQSHGDQASAPCSAGRSGIRVAVTGLKDRTGALRLELYPAVEADFLQDDEALMRAGKVFRRVTAPIPAAGPIGLCIATLGPGRYAMVVIHDRHGTAKFSIARDGVAVPGPANVGRSRPKLSQATVTVGDGISLVATRMQYLRGFAGFGPVRS